MELREAVERIKCHYAWALDPESCAGMDDEELIALRTLIEAVGEIPETFTGRPHSLTVHMEADSLRMLQIGFAEIADHVSRGHRLVDSYGVDGLRMVMKRKEPGDV